MSDWKSYRLRRRDNPLIRSRSSPHGYLEGAGWLADGVLCLSGWLTTSSPQALPVSIEVAGTTLTAKAQRSMVPRPDLEGLPGAQGHFLVVAFEEALPAAFRDRDLQTLDLVHIQIDDVWYRYLGGRDLAVNASLDTELTNRLTRLEPHHTARVAEFLETCGEALGLKDDPLFLQNRELWAPYGRQEMDDEVNNRVSNNGVDGPEEHPSDAEASGPAGEEEREFPEDREDSATTEPEPRPLATSIADPESAVGLSVDHLFVLDERTLLVQGWSWDVDHQVTALLCHPGESVEPVTVGSPWVLERGDVSAFFEPAFGSASARDLGRLDLVRLPHGIADGAEPRFELVLADGSSLWLKAPRPEDDPWRAHDHLFELAHTLPPAETLFETIYQPALECLRTRRAQRSDPLELVLEENLPSAVSTTLIVPVFHTGLEWIEHQMASLADDPKMAESEILYVLDTPDPREDFRAQLFHLSRLYRLPVRGFVTPRRLGWATMAHRAAEVARGSLLVFLRGDVLATGTGWRVALERAVREHQDLGAVGFRLVSENRSLRHAGIHFERDALPGRRWSDHWTALGLPATFPLACEERPVAAVSGACLAMTTPLFHQLGGLADRYLADHQEPLDLCLRALEAGRTNLYLPTPFHHLDVSDAPDDGRPPTGWCERYDPWLFDHRWAEKLDGGLMDGVDPGGRPDD